MSIEAPEGAPIADLRRVVSHNGSHGARPEAGTSRRSYAGESLAYFQGRRRVLGRGEIVPDDVDPAWRLLVTVLGADVARRWAARLARRAGWTVSP